MEARSPNGNPVRFQTRLTTNDGALVTGILIEDEYGLQGDHVEGWVIDIGAHIGIMTVAIAVDFPETKVVAVEAIPDNADLVLQNAALNGLLSRVFVEHAAAWDQSEFAVPITYDYASVGVEDGAGGPIIDSPYVRDSRYIGNIFEYPEGEQQASTIIVPTLSLGAIIAKYEMDEVALLKIDCEGCEYPFLSDPAVAKVKRIIGEFHKGSAGIQKFLRKTHTMTVRLDRGGVGIFEGNRR